MSNLVLDEIDTGQELVYRPVLDRGRAARYFYRSSLVIHLILTLSMFGLWAPVMLAWMLGLGRWYANKRSEELEVRLLPGRLLVQDGVFNKTRKTIPLDKITDVGLQQGIIERSLDLWRMNIQTASSGQQAAEGTLYGIADPKRFRAEVLAQRERWLEGGGTPALPAAPTGERALVRDRPRALAPASPERAPVTLREGAPEPGLDHALERLDRIEALLAEIAHNTRE